MMGEPKDRILRPKEDRFSGGDRVNFRWMGVFILFFAFYGSAGAQTWDEAKPVLVNSCFACHASRLAPAPKPAVSISGEKKRRKEIRRAEASFLMGDTFPFPGKASPQKQAQEMKYMLNAGRMPPNGHRKLGLGERLKSVDRKLLMGWIQSWLN
jgi:hypothetical protein